MARQRLFSCRLLYFERGASMWDTNAVRNMLVLLRSREVRDATAHPTFAADPGRPGLSPGPSPLPITSAAFCWCI